jgi:hypothetical protein
VGGHRGQLETPAFYTPEGELAEPPSTTMSSRKYREQNCGPRNIPDRRADLMALKVCPLPMLRGLLVLTLVYA